LFSSIVGLPVNPGCVLTGVAGVVLIDCSAIVGLLLIGAGAFGVGLSGIKPLSAW